MKRVFLSVTVVLILSSLTMAQDTPKVEVFGGYSYAGTGSHGLAASVAGNLNDWFGLTAEVGGHYSKFTDQGFTEKIQTHSVLFGPRFSLRRNKKVVPFVHALIGAAHLKTETNEFGPLVSFSDNSLQTALGGGLDIRVNDRFAVRAFQVDYLRTSFFDEIQNKGRISAGVVIRFGRK